MFPWNFRWSSAAGQLKHRYKKSFQNIVFHSVYTTFLVKNTVIYTFCRHKSQSKTLVFACFSLFQMLWHPKTFQSSASCNVFFTFGRFSMAGSLPKWPKIRQNFTKMTQNDPKFHFHAFGSSDIQKSSENYENTTSIWTRCQNFVSVRNRFWPPPQLKLI